MIRTFVFFIYRKYRRYPFLKQYEGFNLYDDWNEEDYFLLATGDVQVSGHFYLDVFEHEVKKWLYLLVICSCIMNHFFKINVGINI